VSRWPRFVYGTGDEPDPRFSLANERTFLAWLRTGLALLAAGVALDAFGAPAHAEVRTVTEVVLIALGMVAAGNGWFAWARTERALRRGEPLPAPVVGVLLGAGVLAAAALLVLGLLLGTA